MGIYVEILVRAPLDELWRYTQDPTLHERWDLRFTGISYLPKTGDVEPQRFQYTTRIGFGTQITGEGTTVGTHNGTDGSRTSSLQFWSEDAKSLIREGSGYWRYIPTDDGIRFLTWYDYRTRFGTSGRLIDKFVFRPIMGWATAWSFDRLRLWLEQGESPARSRDRSITYALCRLLLAFVFLYHGLVPKLLAHHPDEIAMLARTGVPTHQITAALIAIGVLEVIWGILLLALWHRRWPLILTAIAMPIALAVVAITSPYYLIAAFTPVTLNLLVACVAVVGLIASRGLPSARHCVRQRPPSQQ